MKFVFLLITCSCISPFAFAGINTVGKGGVFAEMLAIKADQNLSHQINSCLQAPSICLVSDEGRFLAQKLTKSLFLLQATPLEFKTECKDEIETTTTSVRIPSCLLYETNPSQQTLPRSLSDISLIVLMARAQQGNFDKDAVRKLLAPIFQNFDLFEERSVLSWNESQIILHFVVFKQNYYLQEYAFVLENPSKSLDITKIVYKQLCGEEKVTELKISPLGSERQGVSAIFSAEVQWECSNKYNNKLRAKIFIAAQVNEQMETSADSIRVLITHKEPVLW